jgi:hypothetical protein
VYVHLDYQKACWNVGLLNSMFNFSFCLTFIVVFVVVGVLSLYLL